MRILLDENMPRKLLTALVAEGHEVHSVSSLRMDGIDNGRLYELAASEYDLCSTRDAEFANRVRESTTATHLKLLRVVIPQTRQEEFVRLFVAAFRQTDWTEYAHGDDWPKTLFDSPQVLT